MIRSKRRVAISVAVLLSALGGSPPAHADEPNPYGKSAPTEADMAEARKAFDAGVALLEDPEGAKYEDAYRSF